MAKKNSFKITGKNERTGALYSTTNANNILKHILVRSEKYGVIRYMDKISLENYQVEDFISDESFINYFFKSNKADQVFWEQWLAKHPGKMALAEEAIEMLETLSLSISEKEYSEELKKISSTIDLKAGQPGVSQLPRPNKSLRIHQRKKRMMQYLLPLLLILTAGGYWLIRLSSRHPLELTETVNNSNFPLIITLSDSTVVSLAPHGHLQYPLHFGVIERNVYLHGNARFTVKRSIEHPFKVHVENIVATVLGTVFDIKNSGDSAIEVELLKGKLNVEIMNDKLETEQSVLLEPNERAVYVRNDKHLYKSLVGPDNLVYFRQNNFEEIAGKIKNVFGITVINESGDRAWRFTGAFRNSTANEIIENICLVKRLSFTAKGDTIIIK